MPDAPKEFGHSEDKVIDLMAALEKSVKDARAANKRHGEPRCQECGATIQGAPFDGDKPTPRHCWECGAIYQEATS